MFIEKFIINFWRGNLKLWHSFWLVGGFGGIIVSQIIIFIEQKPHSSQVGWQFVLCCPPTQRYGMFC